MADTTPSPLPHANHKKSRRSKRDGECRMVGNWEIGKTIGRGSSGASSFALTQERLSADCTTGRVKIARHIETKQHAAIKIVSKQALITSRMSITHAGEQQEKIMLGIEREIVLMKLIDHPNVLSLYDVYETSNDLYVLSHCLLLIRCD
jgi:serine/threonine-protein kinase HSL1 (negative regulator of Swe1 kinase)